MCEAVAVCCGLTSVAIQWQPMPASARLPSGTGVERLCGHPAQKPGLRAGAGTVAERSARGLRRAQGAVRIVAGNRLDQHSGHEFGRDLAEIGNGLHAGRRVEGQSVEVFADDARRSRIAIEDGANLISRAAGRFSSITTMRSRPRAKLAHDHRIERPHHADLEQAEAEPGRRCRKGRDCRAPATRSCHALPAATTPILASSPLANDTVEAVGARIGKRGRQLVVVEALLLGDRRIDCSRARSLRAGCLAVRG